MRPSLLVALAGLAALVVGCGPTDEPEIPVGPPPTVAMLDCGVGRMPFPVTALASGAVSTDQAAIAEGLRRYVATAGQDAPRAFLHVPFDAAPWHVLRVDADRAAVATGHWTAHGPGRHGQVWTLTRSGSRWTVDGGGDCLHFEPVPGKGQVWATLSAPAGGLDRRTTFPVVLLTPRTCGRFHAVDQPAVTETRKQVTVAWSVPRIKGGVNCPGYPPLRETLTLEHPLGSRVLVDGSLYPPAPVH